MTSTTETPTLDNSGTLTSRCLNCRQVLSGPFCSRCGQDQKPIDRVFWELLSEAVVEIFDRDSKVFRTFKALLFNPGFLSQEFSVGRRARYVQPIRLYLVTSVLYFFILSLQSLNISIDDDGNEIADVTVSTDNDTKLAAASEETEYENLNLSFLGPKLAAEAEKTIKEKLDKAQLIYEQDPKRLGEIILDLAPPVIFCLLPIFALLLKFIYLNQTRYYSQHLVFAVHNHAFIFLTFLLEDLFGLLENYAVLSWLPALIFFWTPIYLLLALKRNYQEAWLLTLIKYLLLSGGYLFLFVVASAIAAFIGLLSL